MQNGLSVNYSHLQKFFNLQIILQKIQNMALQVGIVDNIKWKLSPSSNYSASSAYKTGHNA
jgi:hypothetical protein